VTTLADIRVKVRRLTGRPSAQQISDAQIDSYVNTFYLYDMPENLRLVSLKTNFEFMTEANVDTYDMKTLQVSVGAGTENAVDVYYNLEQPAYVGGYMVSYSQDQAGFYGSWPRLQEIVTTVSGNGTPGPYAFTLQDIPVYQGSLSIGAVDVTGATNQVVDVPVDRATGTWKVINSTTVVAGSINYITGVGTITFANAIPAANQLTISSVPYSAGRPVSMLFFDNVITLRPTPDTEYLVRIEAFKLPSALLAAAESPLLKQWWQYLAYGAAKKIFQDSQDPEGEAQIARGYAEQEENVLRRTIAQYRNERAATIYTEQSSSLYGNYYPNRL
jgi:hypothetical protein